MDKKGKMPKKKKKIFEFKCSIQVYEGDFFKIIKKINAAGFDVEFCVKDPSLGNDPICIHKYRKDENIKSIKGSQ